MSADSENETSESSPAGEATASTSALPDEPLILLPVRNAVLFPGMVLPFTAGRGQVKEDVQAAVKRQQPLGVVLQRDPRVQDPTFDDLNTIGTVANVVRYVTSPEDGAHHLICQGVERFRLIAPVEGLGFRAARVEFLPETTARNPAVDARALVLRQRAGEMIGLLPNAGGELVRALDAIELPGLLADTIAGLLDIPPERKQEILETLDVCKRLDKVLDAVAGRIEVLRLSQEIGEQTRGRIDQRQREMMLREQLRTIQNELGENIESREEVRKLTEAIEAAHMPPEVESHARKELGRLERMPEASSEYSISVSYLEWLTELPWPLPAEAPIDIARARQILDEAHFGLDKVKRRILEYLGVRKLNPHGKAPILCFLGPPGVGKTSLGQSIARALERPFVRVSLGGVHDEAEIRGHRRTYIGAMPGNIIQAIRKAGARNCVMLLDELDKLGQGVHGDPAAAMLEVLDPEQNASFRDNYLGVPFDLSAIVFVATANQIEGIAGPLRDRMEILDLPGYTEAEKFQIAQRFLVPRQLEACGLTAAQCELPDETLRAIIRDYTREAGVRSLERQIGAVFRYVALRVAEDPSTHERIEPDRLSSILGHRRFESEVAMRTSLPGVVTGLAWTPVGGDLLFIEASSTPGGGRLVLTGQLGDVMKESVQAALTLVKSRCESLHIDCSNFDKRDIHVHVPAGAVPKDGPSAGVAMFIAIASLLMGRAVRSDCAVTGEISLRGIVLPVGGIKEKVLAALRGGIKTVLLPARNAPDLEDIPVDARNQMRFVLLETVDDAVREIIEDESVTSSRNVDI
ncbi:endopeptidase La [Paraburkholderia phytofirmans]|uniref:Lon protease n=1 Tax=Paraburkholderia phytofirmans (strain DSM 17436 / LMG 22146 / PsJN) TaxID=398527 RepID=LON_PARPJ|nr:endopeptidase La [Paraburkholderia phytofirmans]B2TFQ5.1 RecName: Full=Lon protease; AltName: Full=ATP-dependent protease La [Paraburkholderia phytofirmans PsJN]ACD20063.1 ATP-dependent protease La [Paraburkholderia phytofirmans PsJN]